MKAVECLTPTNTSLGVALNNWAFPTNCGLGVINTS